MEKPPLLLDKPFLWERERKQIFTQKSKTEICILGKKPLIPNFKAT